MTWEETVIPTPDHSVSEGCPHCGEEFGQESLVESIRQEQAEKSYKAGRRELIEYIDHNYNSANDYFEGVLIPPSDWQTLLKELEG